MNQPNIAVIIPSGNRRNALACLTALYRHEYDHTVRPVLVWDYGMGDTPNPTWNCEHVQGTTPFCFSRNVNLGLEAAGERDGYVILNDDALLRSPGGFSLLYWTTKEHPEIGIIGATTNVVGNENQKPQGIGLRYDKRMVCFVAVYIPRTTFKLLAEYESHHPLIPLQTGPPGMLDEQFLSYGLDDDDLCRRIYLVGLRIGIHDGCYVDHGSLQSSFQASPEHQRDFRPNLRRFIQKWGVDNRGLGKAESPWKDLFD